MKSREPSSLDLFLLALIDSGLSTPYEFQRRAGISVGASVPALRFLLSHKLVTRGKRGERRRMDYRLTPEGRTLLKNSGGATLVERSDLPSALRSTAMVGYLGTRLQALRLLQEYQAHTKVLSVPNERLDMRSPAGMYRWMTSVREHHQQQADLQAISEIIRRLKKRRR